MNYDPDDARITSYVFGELDDAEKKAFENELAENESLREAVDQTRGMLAALESEMEMQPGAGLTESQRDQLASAIASGPVSPPVVAKAKPNPPAESRARMWAMIAFVEAAALLVGGVVVGGSFYRGQAERELAANAMQAREEARNAQSHSVSAMRARDAAGDLAPDASVTPFAEAGAVDESSPAPIPADNRSGRNVASGKSGGKLTVHSQPHANSGPGGPGFSGGTTGGLPNADAPAGGGAAYRNKLAAPGPTTAPSQPAPAGYAGGGDYAGAVPQAGQGLGGPGGAPGAAGAGSGAAGYGLAADPASLSAGAPAKAFAASGAGAGFGGGGIGGGGLGGGLGGMGGGGGAFGGLANSPSSGPIAMDSLEIAPRTSGLDFDDQGRGPGQAGDRFERIVENEFLSPWDQPYSTFSIDVDTASYSKVRMYLMQRNSLPRPDAVRIEELINYIPYSYEPPSSDESAPPFAARMAVSECPWNPEHRLVRIGVKGKEVDPQQRPASNLVFLLDVSGSMTAANKLPLVKQGMQMLTANLNENDTVSIVVYARSEGLVLEPTTGDQKDTILGSLDRLRSGGSTNGGAGIKLAYQTALDNFIKGGVNRVILCTDGDFNVGVTGTDELVRMAEKNAKDGVFLTVLGFGMGNHNDSMLEQISNKGNGNYAFIDTEAEARKVLVEQMSSTLVTIAKDVKIQVEFNPDRVAAYRLIGYENRILATEDFNDDTKDAGEIGAGHAVTALYEITPKDAKKKPELGDVDALKYQRPPSLTDKAEAKELLTLKMRYKKPDEDTSVKLEFPLKDDVQKFGEVDPDFRFTAAIASFGMLLRKSEYRGDASYDAVLEIAAESAKDDETGYRKEFLEMVKRAKALSGE